MAAAVRAAGASGGRDPGMSPVLASPLWLAAVGAALVGLCLVPSARLLAHRVGFVAVPRLAPRHRVAYLGGPAIAIAVIVGTRTGSRPSNDVATAILLAATLGIIGLFDDHRPLPPAVRLAIQAAAALALVASGVSLSLTAHHGIDAALTVVWLLACVNGVNFLDNSDALATCVVGMSAVALAIASGGATEVGVCAAAVAGSAVAFLAFNTRPAAIYLGDGGSMFLGFLLPALGLELTRSAADRVASSWTIVALLALPVIELAVTAMRRVAHGRPVWLSAPDNLSHALARRRFGAVGAFVSHIAVQAALMLVVIGVALGWLRPAVAVGVAFAALAFFAVATRGAPVHGVEHAGMTRRVKFAVSAAVVILMTLATAGVVAGILAYRSASEGARLLQRGAANVRRGDTRAADANFLAAERDLARAHGLLAAPLLVPARAVPFAGPNLDAVRQMVDAGQSLARAGRSLTGHVDPRGWRVHEATVPIGPNRAADPTLQAVAQSVSDARHEIRHIDRHGLLPFTASTLHTLELQLDRAAISARNAADAARVVPAAFGADGVRHYLLVAQNPAEARATGGIPGSFGLLDAQDGRVRLRDVLPVEELDARARAVATASTPGPSEFTARYGRFQPQLSWENVTMSPDSPTVAEVMATMYERETGQHVDGLVSLDPLALRALLRLTGPIRVPEWPGPISADNVVDVTLQAQYARFADQRTRKEFLGRVTRAVWNAAEHSDLGDPSRLARALGSAFVERHVSLWLARPDEEAVLQRLGLTGSVPAPTDDAFFSTAQNANATKLDFYASRSAAYSVTVTPVDASHATVHAAARMVLRDDAPPTLPSFVTGSVKERGHVGDLQSFLSIYSGLGLVSARRDGKPTALEAGREFGRYVYSTFASVPRGGETRFDLSLQGRTPLDGGWYRVRLLPQAALRPESLHIEIRVPRGYVIDRGEGCRLQGSRSCIRAGQLMTAGTVAVHVRAGD